MGRPRKYPLATGPAEPLPPEAPQPTPSIDVVSDVQRVRILSDRIEYLNPTIELTESLWVAKELTNKIRPNRATVSQGVLIVDELNLTIGMTGVRIRTA